MTDSKSNNKDGAKPYGPGDFKEFAKGHNAFIINRGSGPTAEEHKKRLDVTDPRVISEYASQ